MTREVSRARPALAAKALRRLGESEDVQWRVEAAKLAPLYASTDPVFVEELLSKLADDDVALVRLAAASGLARYLDAVDALSRTPILTDWVLCDGPRRREAAACALAADIYVIGAPTAIGVLANDVYAAVREAATRAACARVERAPALYLPILRQRSRDTRAAVRCAALEGLRRAAALGLVDIDDDLVRVVEDSEPATALSALSTIEAVAYRDAEQALAALERIIEIAEELDDEVLGQLVTSLSTMGGDRERRGRALRTIAHRSRSWVRDEAATAAAALA